MLLKYCKTTEIFHLRNIFYHADIFEDQQRTIKYIRKWQCPKVILPLFWDVWPWRVIFFYRLISRISSTNYMLNKIVVSPPLKGFKHNIIVLCVKRLKNATFHPRYYKFLKIQICLSFIEIFFMLQWYRLGKPCLLTKKRDFVYQDCVEGKKP